MDYSKIGERLKLIRERKGLSYEQIFEITKIQPSILRGIEEGKNPVSPVFLKGFIKTYAGSLGLDSKVLFQLSESGAIKKEEIKTEKRIKKKATKKRMYFLYLSPLFALAFILKLIWLSGLIGNVKPKDQGKQEDSNTPERLALTGRQTDSPSLSENSDAPAQKQEETQQETFLTSDQVLFQEIKNSAFTKEILIKSSEVMDIYFKLDKKSTITKRLNPSEWFQIKAKERIYLRFDKMRGDIQVFYNGKKIYLENHKGFFEKSFL